MNDDKYNKAVNTIIKEQEQVVGENVASLLAHKVGELEFGEDGSVSIKGDPKQALADLVIQYSQLFGKASIQVCKEALSKITPSFSTEELPDILK